MSNKQQPFTLKDVLEPDPRRSYKDNWERAVGHVMQAKPTAKGMCTATSYCAKCGKKRVVISQRWTDDAYCIDCDPNVPEWSSRAFDLYQTLTIMQGLRTIRFLVMGISVSYAFWISNNLSLAGDDILAEYVKRFGEKDDWELEGEWRDREVRRWEAESASEVLP